MTPQPELRCVVASEQAEPKGVHVVDGKPRPSPEFAAKALALWKSHGKTREEFAEALDVAMTTVDRFTAGNAPLSTGHTVKRLLAATGIDVSELPLLDDVESLEDWEEEWLTLGRRLNDLGPGNYRKGADQIRKILDAVKVLSDAGMSEIFRATPSKR